jgi:DNA-binding IclR family transcriptional regulator
MRALELLAFAPLSAPKLAVALHSDPRTVRRLLSRLEQEGYVRSTKDVRRVYEPTMRLVALAGQVAENSSVARRARPYVALLHEQTAAAAHLAVPSYQSVLCLVHRASEADHGPPRIRELVPAHCTAGGKALLAHRERWRESVLSVRLERYTERTVVDPATLRAELEDVRRTGYATEDGEFQPRVRAIAAPVLVDGEAVAALTASGRKLDTEAHATRVVAIATQIADDLSDARS